MPPSKIFGPVNFRKSRIHGSNTSNPKTRFDIIAAMHTKISKDKNRLTVTEYDVRPIDENGDVIDPVPCRSFAEARAVAEEIEKFGKHGGVSVAALVIEKHVARYPAHLFAEGDTYTLLEARGNRSALVAGGWDS
jgi:hypothetical protein